MPTPIIEYVAKTFDHHRRSKDPGAWFSVGISLYYAAEVLWQQLAPALTGTLPADQEELQMRLKGPFAMLSGMAIESMLKGAIITNRSTVYTTHNLESLARAAQFTYTTDEGDVLRRLTTFIFWAGRYPVGLTPEQSQESRSLKSTDYANIRSITGRLVREHQQGKAAGS